MKNTKHVLVSRRFYFAILLSIIIPISLMSWFLLRAIRNHTLEIAKDELQRAVEEIKNVARYKFDLVAAYQFQEDSNFQSQLDHMTDLIVFFQHQFEQEFASRKITEETAKEIIWQTISNLRLGNAFSGFLISDQGQILYDPQLPESLDASNYPYIKEILQKKEGIIRYWWKNPGESKEVEKLVAFRTISDWGWIICLSIPISEIRNAFYESQHWEGLFNYVRSFHLLWSSKAMLISKDGNIIVHPEISTENTTENPEADLIFLCSDACGSYKDELGRTWWFCKDEFTPKNWIIAVTASEKDILKSTKGIATRVLVGALICFLMILFLSYRILRVLSIRIRTQARRKLIPF
jgi:hypothetical protein